MSLEGEPNAAEAVKDGILILPFVIVAIVYSTRKLRFHLFVCVLEKCSLELWRACKKKEETPHLLIRAVDFDLNYSLTPMLRILREQRQAVPCTIVVKHGAVLHENFEVLVFDFANDMRFLQKLNY